MIKVYNNGEEQVIKTVLDDISWSGAKDNATRSLSFSFLYNPLVEDIPRYKIAVGDKVEYIEDNKVLFVGYVEDLPYTTSEDTINVTCQDLMARLYRSKFIGRMTGTLTELCNKICGMFGINNGVKSNSVHVHNIVSTGDLTYFDVLTTALSSVDNKAILYLDGNTLKISEKEVIATFETGKNIRYSTYNQSMGEMVNKVIIINNEGYILNSVQNSADIERYGLFQEIYTYNDDVKNNIDEAKKLLKSVTNEAFISCNNDFKCISGRYVEIKEPVNNIIGRFQIIEDNHTIGTADKYMELKLLHE